MKNSTLRTLLSHRSIREYKDKKVEEEKIEDIVEAGMQAPFVSQMYSVIMEKEKENIPFDAPILFTICVDVYKIKKVMEKRDWELVTNDLTLLIFGIQDAAYMAQNMVVAAESMGLGTCYLGSPVMTARHLKEKYNLPEKVFPVVQLVVGYPRERPPVRPRYPLEFVLFEDEYPKFSDEDIERAMETMDQGFLQEDYYRKLNAMISVKSKDEDDLTYDDYSWTEHISRKWGQWYDELEGQMEKLEACGFELSGED